jgi:hypothetical protein
MTVGTTGVALANGGCALFQGKAADKAAGYPLCGGKPVGRAGR